MSILVLGGADFIGLRAIKNWWKESKLWEPARLLLDGVRDFLHAEKGS